MGRSVSRAALQVSPLSRERLAITRPGGGPESLQNATIVPSRRLAKLGWMGPRPMIGRLARHVSPWSSEMATSEALKPSE